jgi:hypothetical protein
MILLLLLAAIDTRHVYELCRPRVEFYILMRSGKQSNPLALKGQD